MPAEADGSAWWGTAEYSSGQRQRTVVCGPDEHLAEDDRKLGVHGACRLGAAQAIYVSACLQSSGRPPTVCDPVLLRQRRGRVDDELIG